MSEQTFWIAVDDGGTAWRSEEKPVWSNFAACWCFLGACKSLPDVPEGETFHGVGRGQCREFKLVPVGDVIDGKEGEE